MWTMSAWHSRERKWFSGFSRFSRFFGF